MRIFLHKIIRVPVSQHAVFIFGLTRRISIQQIISFINQYTVKCQKSVLNIYQFPIAHLQIICFVRPMQDIQLRRSYKTEKSNKSCLRSWNQPEFCIFCLQLYFTGPNNILVVFLEKPI